MKSRDQFSSVDVGTRVVVLPMEFAAPRSQGLEARGAIQG